MENECYIPPSLNYEPLIFGPFTATETVLFSFYLLPALLLSRISIPLTAVYLPFAILLGAISATRYRRGWRPLHLLFAFLSFRIGRYSAPAVKGKEGEAGHDAPFVFKLDGINYTCALSAGKESMLAAFIDSCTAAEGCVHFISVPCQFEHFVEPGNMSACMPDCFNGRFDTRSFYVTFNSESGGDPHFGDSDAVDISQSKIAHSNPLIQEICFGAGSQ